MTKTPAKDLALVLLEMTDGKTHEEIKKFLKEFAEYLHKNGELKARDAIIKEYEALYNKKHNIIEATVTLIQRLPEHTLTQLQDALKKKFQATEVNILQKVDARVLGGMKIQIGDTVYDSSTKNALRQLEAQLLK